jgi:hypothetical protein
MKRSRIYEMPPPRCSDPFTLNKIFLFINVREVLLTPSVCLSQTNAFLLIREFCLKLGFLNFFLYIYTGRQLYVLYMGGGGGGPGGPQPNLIHVLR